MSSVVSNLETRQYCGGGYYYRPNFWYLWLLSLLFLLIPCCLIMRRRRQARLATSFQPQEAVNIYAVPMNQPYPGPSHNSIYNAPIAAPAPAALYGNPPPYGSGYPLKNAYDEEWKNGQRGF
ncbi:hypothetical protein DFJ74DRAFT_713326 [Hyaloraphidium curvatum]|nr:hypothetical protein DFJ74DRAFT_713326 [Hyaloraphidium curvatum]